MPMQTFTESDTLSIASGVKSVMDMIDKITDNGTLEPQYTYLYSDLFVVFNRIYNNGAPLDNSINDNLANEINGDFDNAHYHVSVAIGLAAGIITSPGVSPELSNAKDAMDEANSSINSLAKNVSQIVAVDETLRYVKGLQSVTNDPVLNIDELIRTLFWTMVVSLNKPDVTQQDFQNQLSAIHLEIESLQEAKWSKVFELNGLTINTDSPGTDDDLAKVSQVIGDLGDIVSVLSLVVMGYNWKVKGVNPFQSFKNIYQRIRSTTPAEADETTAIVEDVETTTVEVSSVDIMSGVLAAIGIILLVVGTIIEIVELKKQLDQVDDAKTDFNNQYDTAKSQVLAVIASSEAFRPNKTN